MANLYAGSLSRGLRTSSMPETTIDPPASPCYSPVPETGIEKSQWVAPDLFLPRARTRAKVVRGRRMPGLARLTGSGLDGVSRFEEGEFEGDGPAKEIAAQLGLRGTDAVQLGAQEVDEIAENRADVQRDPLRMYKSGRQRPRRPRGPVEMEPFGHDENRKRRGVGAGFRSLAHDRFEPGGGLRIRVGGALPLADAKRLERAEKIVFSSLDTMPIKRPKRSLASNISAPASAAPSRTRKLSRNRIVLDEIARHHCIGYGAGEELFHEAMLDGLRPRRLARGAQGVGKA